jgi:hypothetical protein
MEVHVKTNKVNIVFDMSKYDLFRLCEARYNYRHNILIGKPGKDERLDRGQVIHAGQEVYYQALKDHLPYDRAVNMALSKIREAGVISTDLDNDVINRIIDVMEEYYDFWQIADQSIVINEVEQPFIYLLFENDEVRLYLAGKIDLVVSDNKYENEPWDHKSYDRSYEVGRMSNQFKNYATALQSNYLTVNMIGMQKTLKAHEKFKRVRLSFDPLMLDEWKQNVIDVLMNSYLTCVAENKWPMNETSCDKYHRRCEYYGICDSSGLPAKNWKINSDYIPVEPWDVTKAMMKSSEIIEDVRKQREQAANAETTEDEARSQTEEA